jgi:hypothetical protein
MTVSGSLRSTGVVVMVTWFSRDERHTLVSREAGFAAVVSWADDRTGAAAQSATNAILQACDMV